MLRIDGHIRMWWRLHQINHSKMYVTRIITSESTVVLNNNFVFVSMHLVKSRVFIDSTERQEAWHY